MTRYRERSELDEAKDSAQAARNEVRRLADAVTACRELIIHSETEEAHKLRRLMSRYAVTDDEWLTEWDARADERLKLVGIVDAAEARAGRLASDYAKAQEEVFDAKEALADFDAES